MVSIVLLNCSEGNSAYLRRNLIELEQLRGRVDSILNQAVVERIKKCFYAFGTADRLCSFSARIMMANNDRSLSGAANARISAKMQLVDWVVLLGLR